MALIRCPECNKEISDKSKQCIHCGYPIDELEQLYDVVFHELNNENNRPLLVRHIREICNLSLTDAVHATHNSSFVIGKALDKQNATKLSNFLKSLGCRIEIITSKYEKTQSNESKLNNVDNVKEGDIICPRCGSSAVTTGQRGFSIVTGFWGSNKTVNRCGKCGYSWQPK